MEHRIRIAMMGMLLLLAGRDSFAQGGTAAVPFLLISNSPETNGMGGISSAWVSNHPMASLGNAAQIGFFALNNFFSAGLYTPSTTDFLNGYSLPDLSYSTLAFNAGVNLKDQFDLPIPLSVGVGYARILFDLGEFNITSPSGPTVIGTYSAYEVCDNILLGVGVDYWVKFGAGVNYRIINSHLSPVGTETEQQPGSGNATAHDIGLLLQVPVTGIVARAGTDLAILPAKTEPLLDLTLGYTKRVIGESIVYVDPAQADPLPRNVAVGAGFELGFLSRIIPQGWKLLSVTFAREADAVLVTRSPDGSWSYQSGSGPINFMENVVKGNPSEGVAVREGWQLDFAEIFSLRGGSVDALPRGYTTAGYGFRLSGLFKVIRALGGDADETWTGFLLKNVDLRYDYAHYTRSSQAGEGESYSSLSLVLRQLPF